MQSHQAVIINGAMTSQMQMRGHDDCVINALPCPHVYANVIMMSIMMFGSKLVLHRTFDADTVLADIEKYQATIVDGVPAMYMFMLNSPALKKWTYPVSSAVMWVGRQCQSPRWRRLRQRLKFL